MKTEGRDPVNFLKDILESIEKIEKFIKGLEFDDFSKDDKTIYAVLQALEIIVEATKNRPDSLKEEYPEVPWRKMTGTRDKIIHGYFSRIPRSLLRGWKLPREPLLTH